MYNAPFCPLTFLGQYLHLLCAISSGYFCHPLKGQHSIVVDSVLDAVHICILLSTPASVYVYKIYKLLLLYLSTNKIYALQNCNINSTHLKQIQDYDSMRSYHYYRRIHLNSKLSVRQETIKLSARLITVSMGRQDNTT